MADLRKKLKDWEYDFKVKNGRSPVKEDVKKDLVVVSLYKEYARLKKVASISKVENAGVSQSAGLKGDLSRCNESLKDSSPDRAADLRDDGLRPTSSNLLEKERRDRQCSEEGSLRNYSMLSKQAGAAVGCENPGGALGDRGDGKVQLHRLETLSGGYSGGGSQGPRIRRCVPDGFSISVQKCGGFMNSNRELPSHCRASLGLLGNFAPSRLLQLASKLGVSLPASSPEPLPPVRLPEPAVPAHADTEQAKRAGEHAALAEASRLAEGPTAGKEASEALSCGRPQVAAASDAGAARAHSREESTPPAHVACDGQDASPSAAQEPGFRAEGAGEMNTRVSGSGEVCTREVGTGLVGAGRLAGDEDRANGGDHESERLTQERLSKLTVVELRLRLGKEGLCKAGSKVHLISRLAKRITACEPPLVGAQASMGNGKGSAAAAADLRVPNVSSEGQNEQLPTSGALHALSRMTRSRACKKQSSAAALDADRPPAPAEAGVSVPTDDTSERWAGTAAAATGVAEVMLPSESSDHDATSGAVGSEGGAAGLPAQEESHPGKSDGLEAPDGGEAERAKGGQAGEQAQYGCRKRTAASLLETGHTWAEPAALRKKPRKAAAVGQSSRRIGQRKRGREEGSGPSCARENFVKLNMQGRGNKRRFVNSSRLSKARAFAGSGKRRYGFKSQRTGRGPPAASTFPAQGDEVVLESAQGGTGCRGVRSSFGRQTAEAVSRPVLWEGEGWLDDQLLRDAQEKHAKGTLSSAGDSMNVGHEQPAHRDGPCLSPLEARESPLQKEEEEGEEVAPALGRKAVRADELAAETLAGPSEANLLKVLKGVFGFGSFRDGQVEAIQSVLKRRSSLLVLPTGAGKSLCYQLPAYLLQGVTLVISPLISLMVDQLSHLPEAVPGGLISSSQTPQQSSAVMARLLDGQLKVLFISPERLFSETFLAAMARLPHIPLAVVDEAHCVSEWSHNFRPSYFRLGRMLQERLRVGCVLALTATATCQTQSSIMAALSVPPAGLIRSRCLRKNLALTISRSPDRIKGLVVLLQQSPFSKAKSVIVYCTFQADADRIAKHLCDKHIRAKSYHSGKSGEERARVQHLFCSNKLRVVVATVAFGMGLDKSDVRAVVHYNMPRSLEHYVQEIGRAGRDGQAAFCHLFLDEQDYLKLRSLAHGEGVDENNIQKFLGRVFHARGAAAVAAAAGGPVNKRAAAGGNGGGGGGCAAIAIEAAARELDMKEEVMATILAYLESGEAPHVRVLSRLNATCDLTFHRKSADKLAESNPLVAQIVHTGQERGGHVVFDVPTVARNMAEPLTAVQSELQRLQACGDIKCELRDPALCFQVLRSPEDICQLTKQVAQRMSDVERCKVSKLDAMFSAASAAVAHSTSSGQDSPAHQGTDGGDAEENQETATATSTSAKTATATAPAPVTETATAAATAEASQRAGEETMQAHIAAYFDSHDGKSSDNAPPPAAVKTASRFLRADIKVFLRCHPQVMLTGRAVARIFHGLWSPAYPYATWSNDHFWGRHSEVDFHEIRRMASVELLEARAAQKPAP